MGLVSWTTPLHVWRERVWFMRLRWGNLCTHLCCLHTAIHISTLCGFWHCPLFVVYLSLQALVWHVKIVPSDLGDDIKGTFTSQIWDMSHRLSLLINKYAGLESVLLHHDNVLYMSINNETFTPMMHNWMTLPQCCRIFPRSIRYYNTCSSLQSMSHLHV